MYAPYKFTGKEQDPETDLTYFGARYYDAALGIWLGVDPLAEKYAGISPFVYTANNPIKYFDPDGKDHIFYMVFQKGAKGANDIAKHAQEILNSNGINLQVQVLYVGKSGFGNGYKSKLDNTDALTFIGSQGFVDRMAGMNEGYHIDGGDSDERVGYVNRKGIEDATIADGGDINKGVARTAIHEGVGHHLLGMGHSNPEKMNGVTIDVPRYKGVDYDNTQQNIMIGGTKVNRGDPGAYQFLPSDLNILQSKIPQQQQNVNINGINVTICTKNTIPIDNFSKRIEQP